MAHFSSTNYDQYHDNYQCNYHHPYNYDNPLELRYVNYDHNYNDNLAYSYNNYNDNYDYNHNYNYNFNYNAYEVAPTKSVVGYYYNYSNYNPDFSSSKNANLDENGEYFYDPVSTQFIISYNNNNNNNNSTNINTNNNNNNDNDDDDDEEDDNASKFKKVKSDLDYEEYDPTPYDGGYDIAQTYGKPLPPSHDICYPPSKPDTSPIQDEINLIDSKDDGQKGVIVPVIEPELNSTQQEENVVHSDEDEDEDEDDDENDQYIENGTIVEQVGPNSNTKHEENVADSEEDEDEAEEDNNKAEIRRQIPPGYGIEAMDICDGLFGYGGYFPCLSKKIEGVVSTNCNECGGEVKVNKVVVDEYECWRGTVDYLFGNPNPYGGAMPEKGSYGDPVSSYHRHCPQKSIVGVNYGYDGDYEYR